MASGPDGEWYVAGEKRDGSGKHAWWGGTDDDFSQEMKDVGGKDLQVVFGCASSWIYINGRNGYCWSGKVPESLRNRISKTNKNNGFIKWVYLLPLSSSDNYCYGYRVSPTFWVSSNVGTMWNMMTTTYTFPMK